MFLFHAMWLLVGELEEGETKEKTVAMGPDTRRQAKRPNQPDAALLVCYLKCHRIEWNKNCTGSPLRLLEDVEDVMGSVTFTRFACLSSVACCPNNSSFFSRRRASSLLIWAARRLLLSFSARSALDLRNVVRASCPRASGFLTPRALSGPRRQEVGLFSATGWQGWRVVALACIVCLDLSSARSRNLWFWGTFLLS